jgi:hypothetical protein
MKILKEFNTLSEEPLFNPMKWEELYRNRYTKCAKIARRVCQLWKSLTDLPSSYEFRITTAVIERRFEGLTPPPANDHLIRFRSDLECKSMLSVHFLSYMSEGAEDEGYCSNVSMEEFIEEIGRIPSYQTRLIKLRGAFLEPKSAKSFLDVIGMINAPSSLTEFTFTCHV